MIASFSSRALRRFWLRGDARRLPAQDVDRIAMILDRLDAAVAPEDMNIPGLHFHALSGDRLGAYAVTVRSNWRITFRWHGEDAVQVDYEDYH